MFRMSHLGPHTYPLPQPQPHPHGWVHHFRRNERHQLVEEDRLARNSVFAVLAAAMLSGLAMLVIALVGFVFA